MQKYQQQEVADEPAMGSLGEQLKRQLEKNRIDE